MTPTRDEIVAAIKQKLDETNAMLDEFEKKAAKTSGEAQAKYEEQLAKLREQSENVQAKMKEFADAGDEAWKGMAAEAEKLRDAFIHSFNYFKSQL